MRLVSSMALFASLACADCDRLYQNTKNPSYGWIQFGRDQAQCQRENSHVIMTDSFEATQLKQPAPDLVVSCLVALGWLHANWPLPPKRS
jgi:hypothetical protein